MMCRLVFTKYELFNFNGVQISLNEHLLCKYTRKFLSLIFFF